MKKHIHLLLTLFATTNINSECRVTTLFMPRSQGVNAARELAGLTNHIAIFDMEKFYGTLAVTPEFTRSFRENDVAQCLFGGDLDCECSSINVFGNDVANRGARSWLADYFALPTDFESSLQFKPRISNYLADFYLYLGLDEWMCGMFFFIHAPIVNTSWDLNVCESIKEEGTNNYPTGYFAPTAIERTKLRDSVLEYMQDCRGIDLGNNVFIEPLNFARMSCRTKKETALADLRFALGWNFFQDEDYHVGAGALVAAPTGTRPKGEYLFEPIVGNGNHWELGGLLWGHLTFWRSECEEKFFGAWLQANITHLFSSKQTRFFDLNCKPLSRYMLAERMTTDVELLLANEEPNTLPNSTVPSNQFNKVFAPVANLTAQSVNVTVGVQADIVTMLTYTSCGFTWDLGYNFWARTCENICPNADCPPRLKNENWALKGNAYVFGFTDTAFGTNPVNTPVALSATQSNATIHSGTNITTGGIAANQNAVIDNRQWAVAGTASPNADALLLNAPAGLQTGTSKDPVILTCADINFDSASTKGLSNKIFTHFSYSWLDNEDWTPYLGLGAEIEFAQQNGDCSSQACNTNPCANNNCSGSSCVSSTGCSSCDSDCMRCGISQWGVWIKGGISFN